MILKFTVDLREGNSHAHPLRFWSKFSCLIQRIYIVRSLAEDDLQREINVYAFSRLMHQFHSSCATPPPPGLTPRICLFFLMGGKLPAARANLELPLRLYSSALANARSSPLWLLPPLGLTRRANAPQLPEVGGGGRGGDTVQLELTNA